MRSWWRDVRRHVWWFGVIAALSFAWSHPDIRVADETFRLEPGDARAFPMAVHYHRLVGTLDIGGGSPDDVRVLVVDEAVWRAEGDDVPVSQAEFAAMEHETGVLNHLLRCCDAGYSDYRLIVRNEGMNAMQVDLRAWAVHDDFAVVVDRAETGAFGVPATLFSVLSISALAVVARRRRSNGVALHESSEIERPPRRSGTADASDALTWSAAIAGIAVVLAVALGLTGALRYATDPVTGMMSVLADVPVPGGPFGSRAAMVMGVLLLAWCIAIGTWIRAAATARRGPVRAVGVALGAISLAGGLAMGIAYGSLLVPGVLGLILGVPLMVAAWRAS